MKKIEEYSVKNEHVLCESFMFEHKKKYGVICYDANMGIVSLLEFDSIEDLADTFCTDEETWLGIDTINVGDRVDDTYGRYYTRVW